MKMDFKSIGLTEAEAQLKLKTDGYNELPSAKRKSAFSIAADVIREPMFILLVACGAIYLALGSTEEAMMLIGFVFVVMGITFYQERKTERALEALRDMSSPRALVIRDGEERRIAGREVVVGDIIVVHEGDRIPADAELLDSTNLLVNESLLTGESVPVRKMAGDGGEFIRAPGGDDMPFIYSGTVAVQGNGVAKVIKTGIGTELGRIGKSLQSIDDEKTRLQAETGEMVKKLAVVGLTLCAAVAVTYGLTRSNWLDGFLAGITLAMATLPEEFPVVLTIFLAMGAWRISKSRVLTRKMPAVETLGAATVLCVDKTGTLTQNIMTVSKLFAHGEFHDIGKDSKKDSLPEAFHCLVEFSILSSQRDPFDPMEKAIHRLGELCLASTEHIHGNWSLVKEYPLSRELLSLSNVWKSMDGIDYTIAAKGAPEAIADLCHFTPAELDALRPRIAEMAGQGLRVLGVARANFKIDEKLPGKQHDFPFEFMGLIGLEDPVRPSVSAAMKECYNAGVRVIMITGDYPATAQNIARQIGLIPNELYITGPELEKMSDADLKERIKVVNIFARAVPEHKHRIVNALKANHEIVAMTGDGVNDAPALKAAHIGIAMGAHGTDVARESASLVLLDDDFTSIVRAVRLGRRIYDNIKKAIAYIIAVHVPIAGMSFIPVLLGWPLVLMPVHILFLELIIDPACSTVFEAEPDEDDVMTRPPRNPKESLFGMHMFLLSVLQGLSVLLIVLAVYWLSLEFLGKEKGASPEARALGFTTLIFANLALILTNRSWNRTIFGIMKVANAAQWWVIIGATGFLAIVLNSSFLRAMFKFKPLHLNDVAICVAAGLFSIFWFEIVKYVNSRRRHIAALFESTLDG